MKKTPRTFLRWVIESLKGKRLDKTYYQSPDRAEMFAPTPSLILKVWVTESAWISPK